MAGYQSGRGRGAPGRSGRYREAGHPGGEPAEEYGYRYDDGYGDRYTGQRYPGERYPGREPYRQPGQYREGSRAQGRGGYRAGPPGERYPDAAPSRRAPRRRDTTGGADGNERLTAITGAVLLVLLAAEGFTILAIHRLLTLHFFIGMLLVGPVLLKAGSTVYRFARYYAGAAPYRRKGPPAPLLRLLGPVVLALSLAVVGSGVMLAITGPSGQIWILAHKASFVLWFMAMAVHVLAYAWRLPRLISGDLATRAGARAQEVLAGRSARWLLVTASILAGLMLAFLTYHLAGAWAGFAGGG